MIHKNHTHSRTTPHFRHRQDQPERHTIAELFTLDPGHHATNRLSGVLTTLERISRVAAIRDW